MHVRLPHFAAALSGLSGLSGTASAAVLPRQNTSASPPSCTTPVVRKEWRQLTTAEKHSYIEAARCLRSQPAGLYGDQPAVANVADELTYTHNSLNAEIHYVAQFLPWHRWLLTRHEQLLRERCGYTGYQPYWDWSIDADAVAVPASPLFDAVLGFGGNGVRTGSRLPGFELCVVDGPFANLTLTLGMGWPDETADGDRSHCLGRDFNNGNGNNNGNGRSDPFTGEAAAGVGDMRASSYDSHALQECYAVQTFREFAMITEGLPHASVHNVLFGDMGPATSPNEPLFYLHHANIDRVWAKWQGRNTTRLSDYAGYRDQDGKLPASPDDPIEIMQLGPNQSVRDYLDTQRGPMCYAYSEGT